MTPTEDERFRQRRVLIERASTYFRSGGRDDARLCLALIEFAPDLTKSEVKRIVAACKEVETKGEKR